MKNEMKVTNGKVLISATLRESQISWII